MSKKIKIILTIAFVVLAIYRLVNPVIKNAAKFTEKYNPKIYEDKYNKSQYVIPQSKNPISDEELLSHAGYQYAKGLNPILINSDHPPLGKYLIGFFTIITGNNRTVSIFFALANIILLTSLIFFLTRSLFLVSLGLYMLSLDTVFLDQIVYSPILDIIQVFFLLIFLHLFRIYLKNNRDMMFIPIGVTLGCLASVKLYFPVFVVIAASSLLLIFARVTWQKIAKYITFVLATAFMTYAVSYIIFFAEGNSFRSFLGMQKWIFLFWKNNAIDTPKYRGNVVPLILFNIWKVWWGNQQYISFEHWSMAWPIFFLSGLFVTVNLIKKLMNNLITRSKNLVPKDPLHQFSLLLSFWVLFFTIYLCLIPVSPRYLMMLYFPIYVLIALYLKIKLKSYV